VIRSQVVALSSTPTALPLGEARGFALAAYGASPTWPVAVTLTLASGERVGLLARNSVWYALGDRVVSAEAVLLAAGAPATTYQLDAGRTREDAALPALAQPPSPGGKLVASWRDIALGGAIGWQSVTLPAGTLGLLWVSKCTAFLSATVLTGLLEWSPPGSPYSPRVAGNINAANGLPLEIAVWGGGIMAGDQPAAVNPAWGNQLPRRLNLLPPGCPFPTYPMRLGVTDAAVANQWNVDVFAI